MKITSNIKKYKSILRLTKKATKDMIVEREINHLIYELSKDNLEAGIGHPGHIEGTDIIYLRARNGGRLYVHRTKEGYEIVGKSAKGTNQDKVIKALKEIYSH